MFKAIHGIAPNYLSDRIDMHFDIHGYGTRDWMFIYQLCTKRYTEIVVLYFVKNTTDVRTFKRNLENYSI